ncbi:hypothetical protein BLA6992_07440 [Burkholderia lata]|nr:hypothetical protein BLA6992_07440 [Burkholderia lata]
MHRLPYAAPKATLYWIEFRGDTLSPFAPILIFAQWRRASALLAIKLCKVSTDGFGTIPRLNLGQQLLVLDLLVYRAPGVLGILSPSPAVLLASSTWCFVLNQIGYGDHLRLAIA